MVREPYCIVQLPQCKGSAYSTHPDWLTRLITGTDALLPNTLHSAASGPASATPAGPPVPALVLAPAKVRIPRKSNVSPHWCSTSPPHFIPAFSANCCEQNAVGFSVLQDKPAILIIQWYIMSSYMWPLE